MLLVKRAARLGDGWMPIMAPDAQAEQKLAALRQQLKSFGRDPAKFGLEAWLRMADADPQGWAAIRCHTPAQCSAPMALATCATRNTAAT